MIIWDVNQKCGSLWKIVVQKYEFFDKCSRIKLMVLDIYSNA